MSDHRQCSLRVLVVDRVVDGAQLAVVVEELAVHGEQQRDRVGLVLHGGQMQRSVLDNK